MNEPDKIEACLKKAEKYARIAEIFGWLSIATAVLTFIVAVVCGIIF